MLEHIIITHARYKQNRSET